MPITKSSRVNQPNREVVMAEIHWARRRVWSWSAGGRTPLAVLLSATSTPQRHYPMV
jgi:hypothetical protein